MNANIKCITGQVAGETEFGDGVAISFTVNRAGTFGTQNILVAIDTSGSMSAKLASGNCEKTRIDVVTMAVVAAIEAVKKSNEDIFDIDGRQIRERMNLYFMRFDQQVRFIEVKSEGDVEQIIAQLQANGTATDLGQCIDQAIVFHNISGAAKTHLLLMTDGFPQGSGIDRPRQFVTQRLSNTDLITQVICFGEFSEPIVAAICPHYLELPDLSSIEMAIQRYLSDVSDCVGYNCIISLPEAPLRSMDLGTTKTLNPSYEMRIIGNLSYPILLGSTTYTLFLMPCGDYQDLESFKQWHDKNITIEWTDMTGHSVQVQLRVDVSSIVPVDQETQLIFSKSALSDLLALCGGTVDERISTFNRVQEWPESRERTILLNYAQKTPSSLEVKKHQQLIRDLKHGSSLLDPELLRGDLVIHCTKMQCE